MKMTLEIINYFRNDEMVNDNTPFSIGDYDLALKEIESLKCCQNCKHYSMFDGKIQCKNCFAVNYTNWEAKE